MIKQFFDNSIKRISSLSPQAAIAGALIIVVVISGLALLLTRGGSEANANPALQPHAARLDRVEGNVGLGRAEDGDQSDDWTEATVNTPVTVGDRIYTRDYAHASVALSGQNYVRLNPATSLDVLALEDSRTQFALRSGSAIFDIGDLPSGELYEVATPCGAVDFREPGLYQIGMDGGNAIISVLNGLAQIVGQEGSGLITKGQVFTLTSATAAEALASTLAPDTAGEIVDDYYRYRYPKVYNGRYRSYDAYLDDPSYYDPYRTSVSYQYLPADIAGLNDLDDYGDWVDVADYGHCWAPRVDAGWAPYRSGYWDMDDLWGPSWVSSEPWGWAPYHYGRWTHVNQRWFWVPAEVRTRAVYSPAPVAFIPVADQIAWVPLGPGELYATRYYDDFQPRYLASPDVVQVVTVQNTFVNFNAPGGLTVVPVRALRRGIDPHMLRPVDVAVVGRSRAVIDPFSVAGVRELAVKRGDGRRRIKFERHEQEALNTAVVASTSPAAVPARGDLAKRFRVEAVSEKRRENKLKVNDTAQVISSRRSDGLAQPVVQSLRMSELASRAQQGDKSARREMRQLMREQQQQGAGKPSANQPGAQPQAFQQQEQLRQQMKQQRKAERQQAAGAPPVQQQEQLRQQMKQQRKAERQQAAGARPVQQQEQLRQQMKQQQQIKQQRKAEQAAGAARQQDAARQVQQQQQMKQQRKAERQQQQMRQQQPPQPKQAQPPAKRRPPEASLQRQMRQDQRQAVMQQQAARAQASQRQAVMQQQAARAQKGQRQAAMQQQAAQRQAMQQQAAQQQAASAQKGQRQAAMQQQAAQRQAMQQQAVQQQAARAQKGQRQAAMQQQAAQRQAMQQQAVQQQAARAQKSQRQAASPPQQRAPVYMGPPARQDLASQSQRKAEKAQRKPQH